MIWLFPRFTVLFFCSGVKGCLSRFVVSLAVVVDAVLVLGCRIWSSFRSCLSDGFAWRRICLESRHRYTCFLACMPPSMKRRKRVWYRCTTLFRFCAGRWCFFLWVEDDASFHGQRQMLVKSVRGSPDGAAPRLLFLFFRFVCFHGEKKASPLFCVRSQHLSLASVVR